MKRKGKHVQGANLFSRRSFSVVFLLTCIPELNLRFLTFLKIVSQLSSTIFLYKRININFEIKTKTNEVSKENWKINKKKNKFGPKNPLKLFLGIFTHFHFFEIFWNIVKKILLGFAQDPISKTPKIWVLKFSNSFSITKLRYTVYLFPIIVETHFLDS